MRFLLLAGLVSSIVMSQIGVGAEPIYLGLLDSPVSMERSAPQPELFGEWVHKLATPDGPTEIALSVSQGPGKLAVVNIHTEGGSQVLSPLKLVASVCFYRMNDMKFSIVTKHVTAQDVPSIGTFLLPISQLVTVEADASELKIRMPNIAAVRLLEEKGAHIQQITNSSFLLVDKSAIVDRVLEGSISSECFSEKEIVFIRRRIGG